MLLRLLLLWPPLCSVELCYVSCSSPDTEHKSSQVTRAALNVNVGRMNGADLTNAGWKRKWDTMRGCEKKRGNYRGSQPPVEVRAHVLIVWITKGSLLTRHRHKAPFEAVNEPLMCRLNLWPQLSHSQREELRWLLVALIDLFINDTFLHVYGCRCVLASQLTEVERCRQKGTSVA